MAQSRRNFLKHSGYALGATALVTSFERFGLVNALAQQTADYKALVCIFLNGGNDGNNMILPFDEYQAYNSTRGFSTGLNIPQANLLPITAASHQSRQFGLPGGGTVAGPNGTTSRVANLTGMHELWSQEKLAVLCNAGPLVEPLTKDQYRNNTARKPLNLFSHSDQQAQWQTSISSGPSPSGWGGRTVERIDALNEGAQFPTIVSVAGVTIFSASRSTRPLALVPGTPLRLEGFNTSATSSVRYEALQQLLQLATGATLTRSANETTAKAIENAQAIETLPALTTAFPNTSLGNQLKQVGQLIKLNASKLNLKRQLFFCSLGGFDTHNGQPNTHADLLTQLGTAMRAFYSATEELGVAPQVTTFTLSDFARTFKPNGSVGTDHGWGGHHFIMGGAVRGGDFYGQYPTLAPNGPDDTDAGSGASGRWIPTTSVDQYAATLATWYGVPQVDIPAVFPNINRFATSDLGFLNNEPLVASKRPSTSRRSTQV